MMRGSEGKGRRRELRKYRERRKEKSGKLTANNL